MREFLRRGELPEGWEGVGALEPAAAAAFTHAWRGRLYAAGLLGITWPREYGGRGLTRLDQVVLVEELARAGAPAG